MDTAARATKAQLMHKAVKMSSKFWLSSTLQRRCHAELDPGGGGGFGRGGW